MDSAQDPEDKVGLEEGSLVDFDADGVFEFIEPRDTFGEGVESRFMDSRRAVYKLDGGQFRLSPLSVPYFAIHQRLPGKLQESDGFTAEPGDYMIQAASGENGSPLVDAAEVTLNGVVVMTPDDFSGKKRSICVPVSLRAENTIRVEVRSKPGSILSIALVRAR